MEPLNDSSYASKSVLTLERVVRFELVTPPASGSVGFWAAYVGGAAVETV